MNNWLLIVVGVIFLVGMVVGGIRGFFKIGLSLLSSVLTIILVIYLSPYAADALVKYTPVDEMIEEKCIEMFMPELSADLFEGKDLTGTPLAGIDPEQFQNMSDLDLSRLGITASDVVKALGEIPKDQQIKELEESNLPQFLKDALLENNNTTIYEELGVQTFAAYVASYKDGDQDFVVPCDVYCGSDHCQSADGSGGYYRRTSGDRVFQSSWRCGAGRRDRTSDRLGRISCADAFVFDGSRKDMF